MEEQICIPFMEWNYTDSGWKNKIFIKWICYIAIKYWAFFSHIEE